MKRLRMSLNILMYKLVLTLSLPRMDWANSVSGDEFSAGVDVDPFTEVAAFPSPDPSKRSKSDRPSTGVVEGDDLT